MQLYENASHPVPKDLYVSCPFSDATYEGSPYRLEYSVIEEHYAYSKKYIFYVPQHKFIGKFFFSRLFIALFINSQLFLRISYRGWHSSRNIHAFYIRRLVGFVESSIVRTTASVEIQCDGLQSVVNQ